MVATPSKKCPPNIRTAGSHPPVLVSPISVAHRNKMLESEGGAKKSNNWMRDQWVANLKKKRMANNSGNASDASTGSCSTSSLSASSSSSSLNDGYSKNYAGGNPNPATPGSTNKDNKLVPPASAAMFNSEFGSFEIESHTMTRVPSRSTHVNTKKSVKPLMKKRANCLALEVNQPKPRTPRRKLNSGNAFEDLDLSTTFMSTSNNNGAPGGSSSASNCFPLPSSFSSVGTPSNFNAEVSRMWGPEIDFGPNAYTDSFLDLPTPKSAEMPTVSSLQFPNSSGSANGNGSGSDHLHQPKLIRTTSIEQEGLSHFFEQTHLGNANALAGKQPLLTPSSLPPNLDDCFTKFLSSPHLARKSKMMHQMNGLTDHSADHDAAIKAAKLTLCNTLNNGSGANGSNGVGGSDCSGASIDPSKHRALPEFEALLEDYKFTDIDQELDSFYIDSFDPFSPRITQELLNAHQNAVLSAAASSTSTTTASTAQGNGNVSGG